MNIIIFGGSFNPPHNAHLEMMLSAAEQEFCDKILILPANIPPHKAVGNDFADTNHRINMCKILADYSEKAELCTVEIDRGGKSYMIDTVNTLSKKYQGDKLWLLVGADMVTTLKNWYKGDELISKIGVVAVGRNTVEKEKFQKAIEELKIGGCEVFWLPIDTKPISSTIIREKLKNGDCDLELPEEIFDYIKENQLYKGNA